MVRDEREPKILLGGEFFYRVKGTKNKKLEMEQGAMTTAKNTVSIGL